MSARTIGSIGWQIIEGACELVASSCSHCTDAPSLYVFMRDVVNIKIGKPIFDKKNFKEWMAIIGKADYHETNPDEMVKAFDSLLDFVKSPLPKEIVVAIEHNEDTL